jgi:hypothetical protein
MKLDGRKFHIGECGFGFWEKRDEPPPASARFVTYLLPSGAVPGPEAHTVGGVLCGRFGKLWRDKDPSSERGI